MIIIIHYSSSSHHICYILTRNTTMYLLLVIYQIPDQIHQQSQSFPTISNKIILFKWLFPTLQTTITVEHNRNSETETNFTSSKISYNFLFTYILIKKMLEKYTLQMVHSEINWMLYQLIGNFCNFIITFELIEAVWRIYLRDDSAHGYD